MSFNAKQRAVLLSVRDRKWRVIDGRVRVYGRRNNGLCAGVCPVCAAAIKVRPMEHFLGAWRAARLAGLDLSREEVHGIIDAADWQCNSNRAELLALLGVTP